jgi:SAM-dependent methyltransferase
MVILTPQPHDRRDIAEGFGSDASRYERARPRYPRELAELVLNGLSGRRVLDVGIGTGISALPFLDAGASVLGVEVDERMATIARERGIPVEIARFEEWDAAGRTFDAVIAGQTWHWIDPTKGAERAAAILPAGGRVALFWNAGDPPAAIGEGFANAYRSLDTGLPFSPYGNSGSAADGYRHIVDAPVAALLATGAFDEPTPLSISWQATITRDAWLDQVPTSGGHNRIPKPALSQLLQAMGEVIDAAGGEFIMNYTTVGITTNRIDGSNSK